MTDFGDNLDVSIEQEQRELAELTKLIESASAVVVSRDEETNKLREQEAEMARLLQEMKQKRRALEEEYQNQQRRIKQLRADQDDKNRKLQKLLNEKRNRAELDKLNDEFDRVTIGAPWREFAYNHQIVGAKHCAATKRVLLGDKRGLGKTLTSLIYLDMSKAKKTIIFTPKDVSRNFESEVKRWTPNRPVIVLTGMDKVKRDMVLMGLAHAVDCTVIMNYEAARKDSSLISRIIETHFDTLVIDELHKIKNYKGVDYKGIYGIAHAVNLCPACGGTRIIPANPAKRQKTHCASCLLEETDYLTFRSIKNILGMSGTLMINRPQEIWPGLQLIDPINFGSLNNFLYDYCAQGGDGRWYFKWGGEERLLKSLGMKYIGRTPESAGVKMPPQTAQHHEIEFDPVAYPKQWKVMEQIRKFAAIKMSENVALPVVGKLAELIRLAQAATWPGGIKIFGTDENGKEDRSIVLYESDAKESAKIDKAVEIILEAIEEGDRVVLFSRFVEALKEVQRRLTELGITNVRYDGDLNDRRAREAQLDFDIKTAPIHGPEENCSEKCPNWDAELHELGIKNCEGYKYQVLLGQYQKAGTGLNLTGARQMVILDRYYAYAYEDQATGRIQRLDSTQKTIVHIITLLSPLRNKYTIDQWMNDLIEAKKKMSEGYDQAHLASDFMKALLDGDII